MFYVETHFLFSMKRTGFGKHTIYPMLYFTCHYCYISCSFRVIKNYTCAKPVFELKDISSANQFMFTASQLRSGPAFPFRKDSLYMPKSFRMRRGN